MEQVSNKRENSRLLKIIKSDFIKNKNLYIMVLPVVLFYVIFMYVPMYGSVIAFQNYSPGNSLLSGPWVGLSNFKDFISGYYFFRVIRNTLLISLNTLIFEFPAPIILALMINAVTHKGFKRTVQSITYLPHFISMIVICGMILDFTRDTGLITSILGYIGFKQQTMLQNPDLFLPIYVISEIWQKAGWSSIIYLAALTNVDPQLYDAAYVDGAGKWKQLVYVTIPGILPTIIILFILRMGSMLSVGFEKIILLYNPIIYEKADVISSFVYRSGFMEMNWSFSSAVGLFNAAINFIFLISANWISKKLTSESLW